MPERIEPAAEGRPAELPLREVPLDPTAFLLADTPLARAAEEFLPGGAPLGVAVGREERLPVLESDLRFALQDGGAARPLGEVAREGLACHDAAAARARLLREPTLAAVLIDPGGDAPPRALERVAAPITTAVVMAGGLGQRLRPLTEETPKPLLEVGGRPLLFRILEALRAHGVVRAHLSIRYLGDQVRAAVGDGSAFGLEVSYLEEDRPLDTGAGLVLLEPQTAPFLVVNGDLFTALHFGSFARHHVLSGNLATVATYLFAAPLPYGLVHADGHGIGRIEEKPVFRYPVNAGIYAFAPEALAKVRPGEPLAMVDFLNWLATEEHRVGRFPLVEHWNDVGSHADFERAQREARALGEGGS